MKQIPESEWTPEQKQIRALTTKLTLERAAEIIDKITLDDVVTSQAQLLQMGNTLTEVSKLDRALIASAHFRALAKGIEL